MKTNITYPTFPEILSKALIGFDDDDSTWGQNISHTHGNITLTGKGLISDTAIFEITIKNPEDEAFITHWAKDLLDISEYFKQDSGDNIWEYYGYTIISQNLDIVYNLNGECRITLKVYLED